MPQQLNTHVKERENRRERVMVDAFVDQLVAACPAAFWHANGN
jgi:hypothetical protein